MTEIYEYSQHRILNLVFNIFILLILLMSYSGMAYPVYPMIIGALILFSNKLRYKEFDIFAVLLILIFSCLKLFEGTIPSSLLTLKYFFGFIIFYLLFRHNSNYIIINFNYLLIAISIVLIIEAVLINTILPAIYWPHFPKGPENELSHIGKVFGIYQRPYGIGTNASVTTTIIVCLLLIRDKVQISDCKISRFASFISIIAVFISLSGTGFFLLFTYFVLKKLKFTRIAMILFFCLFLIIYLVFQEGEILYELIYKISPVYIEYVIQLKFEQIFEAYSLNSNLWELLLGKKWIISDPVPLGGDFGLLNFIVYGGLITLLTYILIIFKRINRYNFLVIIILIVGAVHYAAIFSTPGQLIFSFCLSLDENKIKMYQNIH